MLTYTFGVQISIDFPTSTVQLPYQGSGIELPHYSFLQIPSPPYSQSLSYSPYSPKSPLPTIPKNSLASRSILLRIFRFMNRYAYFFLFLLFQPALFAQHEWTVEDIITQESISNAVFSPNGNMVAWTKRRASGKKDRFVTDLYLTHVNLEEFIEIQLTRTEESDRNPVFSADGNTLYFLSSRDGGKSLWAINTMGGEAYAVDSFDNGISRLRRLNDSMLIYSSTEGKTLYERELKKKKDDVVVVEDSVHQSVDRLFSFNLKTKESRRLTDNQFPLGSYAASRDGQWLVTSHTLSPHYDTDGKPRPKYFLWDLVSKSSEEIFQDDLLNPGRFTFTESGAGFYFAATQTSDPEWEGAGISILYYFDMASKSYTQVNMNWVNGISGGIQVIGEDALVTLANGATNVHARYKRIGDRWRKWNVNGGDKNYNLSITSISDAGNTLLLTYSTASHLPEVLIGGYEETDSELRLTDVETFTTLNKKLAKKPLAKSEIVTWTGALDEEVTGILIYPHDYEEGRRYPLAVAIHGGPSGVDRDRWSDRWAYPHQLLAQEGMFILKPNYHGSSNHGQEFVESIKKHYYEYELPDILAGIDLLESEGKITKDSMAVIGWSNGAILGTMLTVEYPGLFKVAALGAGDVNWSSDFGTCAFGVTFDQSYFGGAPWDNVDGLTYNPAYILKSPLFEMEKVRTPTLIHHGSEDRAVPRDQGWEYYRALQQVGKAPVRFLWYPGQPHGLGKLSHQRRKVEEEMRWISQYLFGKDQGESEVMKKTSPLTARLELENTADVNGLFGKKFRKYLIPETRAIAADSIEIGVFEVTNAQFMAFRKGITNPKTDQLNHPITGVSYELAVAYCEWLSDKTGETYRLPTAEEATSWQAAIMKAAANENTLRYWADYTLTVDEAATFQAQLPANTVLTLPAGTFPSVKIGAAKVYDLGGNVSEWTEEGKLMGYGFLDYADPSDPDSEREKSSSGFRVIRE